MKIFIFLLILLSFSAARAQDDFEYGAPAELKGLKKIYVDTRADLKSRERIIKEITDSKTDLTIVERADDAEIILLFESGFAVVDKQKRSSGKGFVFVRGRKASRRVVMNFESVKDLAIEKKPASKFARAFLDAYRKANRP
jgi:hypothetical protein